MKATEMIRESALDVPQVVQKAMDLRMRMFYLFRYDYERVTRNFNKKREGCTNPDCTNCGVDSEEIRAIGECVPSTEVSIWTGAMYEMATRGASEAFGDVLPPDELFIRPVPQFWYLPDGVPSLPVQDQPPDSVCIAQLFLPIIYEFDKYPCYHLVHVFFSPHTTEAYIHHAAPIAYHEPVDNASALFIAQYQFMNLKLCANQIVQMPRSDRRRLERERQPIPPVRLIQLRKRAPTHFHTDTEREYYHRWLVKGHWRRLPNPRKRDGAEAVYVEPYVKGPEGAPMLQPRQTIYAVTR